jgi:predicted nucleotidyltransferase
MSELGSFEDAWRERFAQAGRAREELAREARARLEPMCARLVQRYGVRRIWLFGSLAEGAFREGSDIDLAVEGLPGGSALFRAGVELEEIACPFPVDLVPLEEARPSLREKVLSRGTLLHDRS